MIMTSGAASGPYLLLPRQQNSMTAVSQPGIYRLQHIFTGAAELD